MSEDVCFYDILFGQNELTFLQMSMPDMQSRLQYVVTHDGFGISQHDKMVKMVSKSL